MMLKDRCSALRPFMAGSAVDKCCTVVKYWTWCETLVWHVSSLIWCQSKLFMMSVLHSNLHLHFCCQFVQAFFEHILLRQFKSVLSLLQVVCLLCGYSSTYFTVKYLQAFRLARCCLFLACCQIQSLFINEATLSQHHYQSKFPKD